MADSNQGDLFSLPLPAERGEGRGEPPPATAKTPAWRRTPEAKPAEARPAEPKPPEARPPEAEKPRAAEKKPEGPKVLTVSQLTRRVKDTLEPQFTRVLVRGEISNFRGVNARGHFFFALKDARSSIDVKLWATTAQRLKFQLREGLSVVIEGSLDVYEPQGRYSLIVDRLEPEGVGAQALAFEQLKQKLLAEGLIGPQRKRAPRPLPFLPRRIGVVTSVTGAALRDFLKVLHRRHPRLSVLVADARVQGDGAVFELRRALRWMNRQDVDVVVVTRGGGSADDLSTFNEEPVVRALWECRVPVVSAVGHEIDTTLCDLVADVRAPTPSAAAEVLAPQLSELEAQLATSRARLQRAMEKTLLRDRAGLRALRAALGEPRRELSSQRLVIANAAERLTTTLRRRVRTEDARLRDLSTRLQRTRPQALLQARRAELAAARQALVAVQRRRVRVAREQGAPLSRERLISALTRRVRTDGAVLRELAARLQRARPQALLHQRRVELSALRSALVAHIQRRLRAEREQAARLGQKLERHSPRPLLTQGRALVARQRQRLDAALKARLQREREALRSSSAQLDAYSPLKVLARGYALVRDAEGRVVRRADEVTAGAQLSLKLGAGELSVEVTKVKPA